MLKYLRVIFLILLLSPVSIFSEDNTLYHDIRATLLVADVDVLGDLIAQWAEDSGGYLLLKSTDRIVVRFPYTKISLFREFLEQSADLVVEIAPQAVDLREHLLGLQSGIRSREEILLKNLAFIDQADVTGTLDIEKEILTLLGEIEELKGKLRKLNVDRAMARAEVNLSFMEQSLPEDIPSSFSWINTVDFYAFIWEGFYW